MLLTIPNSALDSLCPTTEQFESTQVEVSLDRRASQHSIVVLSSQEEGSASIESVVMHVPSGLKKKWPSPRISLSSSSRKQLSPRTAARHDARQDDHDTTTTLTRHRQADLERDRSPVQRDRPTTTSRRLPAAIAATGLVRRTVEVLQPLPVVRTSRAAQKVLEDGSCGPSPTLLQRKHATKHQTVSKTPNLAPTSLVAALSLHKKNKKVAPVAI